MSKRKDKSKHRRFWGQHVLLALFIVYVLAITVSLLTKTSLFPYNIENYRYLFSALIQVIGSILALVVSSILIGMQLLHTKSSRMISYFPKELYIQFSMATLFTIAIDIIALLCLESDLPLIVKIVLPWVAVFNLLVLFMTITLINSLVFLISPRTQIAQLIVESQKASTSEEWSEILYAFEEIFCSGIKSGEGGNVAVYQQSILMIINSMENRQGTDHIDELQYPLRNLPGICGHLIAILLDNEMSSYLFRFGDIFRRISEVSELAIKGANIELALTIKTISKLCLDRMCINEFCDMCAQFINSKDEAEGVDTLLLSIQYIVDQVCSHSDRESAAYVFSRIITDIQRLLMIKGFSTNIKAKKIVNCMARQADLLAILDSRGHSVTNQIAKLKKLTTEHIQ